ncbi:MAG TPA: DUF4350 domain-containing protein [Chthoniobacteraceae bacterium]|nr:DUF4350 domain-containing protein [Chthoniobacteraceae bacterium]
MLKPRILFVLLAAGFLYGVIHLFGLRFEAGDVYPPYSSLRADPLGVKGLHDALDDLPQFDVHRNYRPLPRLQLPAPPTLLYPGTVHHAAWRGDELRAAEGLLTDGARIVIAFYPVTRPPPPRDRAKEKEEQEDGPEADDAKKSDEEPQEDELAETLSFQEVAERWGFSFDYLAEQPPTSARTGPARSAVLDRDAPPGLEKRISWHSAVFFIPDANEWNVIYRCEGEPVLMERKYNRGSIVLAADSFFLSNEALRTERAPALLGWLLGDARIIVFDEESHNIRANPGLMHLARKYHLHGLGAGLLLLAFLFVWQNASPLVPAFAESGSDETAVRGKRAEEGFVNLLRRSIPPREIVRVCAEEWRHAFDPKQHDSRADEIIRLVSEDAAKSGRARDVVARFREISRAVAAKKFSTPSS